MYGSSARTAIAVASRVNGLLVLSQEGRSVSPFKARLVDLRVLVRTFGVGHETDGGGIFSDRRFVDLGEGTNEGIAQFSGDIRRDPQARGADMKMHRSTGTAVDLRVSSTRDCLCLVVHARLSCSWLICDRRDDRRLDRIFGQEAVAAFFHGPYPA